MTTPEPHDYRHLSQTLVNTLCLDREPVGIKHFSTAREYAAWPAPEPAAPTYYCGFVKIAAGRGGAGGKGYKIREQHFRCSTAAHLLGVNPCTNAEAFAESYVSSNLYRDTDVAQRALADTPTLSHAFGFAIQPLSEFGALAAPDVVIVIAPSLVAMRLVQGYSFSNARGALAQSVGMHGICAESTAAPLTTGRVCLSLLCSGTRHAAKWGEGEVSVSMPASCLHGAVDGVLKTLDACEPDQRKRSILERGLATGQSVESSVRLGSAYFCERPVNAAITA